MFMVTSRRSPLREAVYRPPPAPPYPTLALRPPAAKSRGARESSGLRDASRPSLASISVGSAVRPRM